MLCDFFSDISPLTSSSHLFIASLDYSNQCPTCRASVGDSTQLFPNHNLNDMALKYRRNQQCLSASSSSCSPAAKRKKLMELLRSDRSGDLDLPEVNNLLKLLQAQKSEMEAKDELCDVLILKEFLMTLQNKKRQTLQLLQVCKRSVMCHFIWNWFVAIVLIESGVGREPLQWLLNVSS